MTESERIADQIRRAMHGEAWYGDSIGALLNSITAVQAASRPIPNAHSIWEIVVHITAWVDIIGIRLAGESKPVTPEMDWPSVTDTSGAAWNQTVTACKTAHDRLAEKVVHLPESRLADDMTGHPPDIYSQLHGIVQHSLYHAGQISMLKKFR